uniref:Branched-chain amino acid aminotransferase n=2 Tax=Tetraselmis sp. GSL018 TaxID=582737 RepID=A0A061QQ17_9CHLO|mmetsp:Transcript_36002/g.85388  ORF Transcript_36002/g.85388 Transcript_36002/m.85388 type:complete len:413 (-) Transcript_36002:67-1305(-)|eukprot:CAMPEP_0177617874 /NCGR_PEP_ID=MMETSP0419_2-20121207/25194_1 /TAXON_ID=582737 /ORGANISM="Tetraselmis sp., Strain GSL018" /LENGTH=412 /DNA_ID=CAMNT_0019116573 /DNA_START=82 /DNA_END=1320 /DNA_ORIENTATION=+
MACTTSRGLFEQMNAAIGLKTVEFQNSSRCSCVFATLNGRFRVLRRRRGARQLSLLATFASSQSSSRQTRLKRQPIPQLEAEQVIQRLRTSIPNNTKLNFLAFFSSDLGGITTEPAFMQLPIDDHMVHRGHGVFDTCILVDGYLYMLEQHIDRLLESARKAEIRPFWTREVLKNILHDTAATSGVQNGFLRFWLTAGRGGFDLGSRECDRPGFYCIVTHRPEPRYYSDEDRQNGFSYWRAKTTPIETKSPFMSSIKSNNYLQNVLSAEDAERDEHATHGIFVDPDGFVSEGGNFNVGFILPDGELVIPSFDNCLAGITAQRIMELVPKTRQLSHLRVSHRRITVTEAKGADEMFATGSTTLATPIVQWDRTTLPGNSTNTLIIRRVLENDMEAKPPHELHTEVDYGIMTYMQ